MRQLFTDRFNSLSHFIFGLLGAYFWFIIPAYVGYQYIDIHEPNVRIDLSEFFIGCILAVVGIQYGFLPEFKSALSFTEK